MNGVSFGPHSFSDLDFADDVTLLAELIDLLVPALETMASEASSLGLEVNWQKTKVQAVGSREDEPLTITAQGQQVAVVEEFVYLGSRDSIFTRVWKDEVIPEEWHQGIIIPLYKGKGSRSDCSNYRGITLLSVPLHNSKLP